MRRIILTATAVLALALPAAAQAQPAAPGYPARGLPAASVVPHNHHPVPALWGTRHQYHRYHHWMRLRGWTPIAYGWSAERSHNPDYWLWTYRLWYHRAHWAHKHYLHHKAMLARHPSGSVEQIIDQVFGPAAPSARAVASCESGFNPYAHNASGASGVFQLMPFWWDGGNSYGWSFNPYDAYQNVAHAYIISAHGTNWSDWVCQP